MSALRIVEGPYLQDILEQPDAVARTVEALGGAADGEAIRRRVGSGRRIVLTGMGTSFHALQPLRLRLVGHGLNAVAVETSELIGAERGLLHGEAVVVAVSQSGRSAEILRLLRRARGEWFVIGVTNTAGSPLYRQAGARVLTQAGEEFSVSCKTYVAMLAALEWLGEVLCGGDAADALRRLRRAPEAMRSYLRGWRRHVASLARLAAGVEDVFLAGRGVSLAAAATGGLIVKEAAHVHGEGMSAAAFRHGPLEMVGPRVLVLVFAGRGEARRLNERLVGDVRRAGGRAELIGERARRAVLRLPPAPEAVRPLLEILPVQMLTLALAGLAGREAGRFERASKVTTVE